MVGRLLSRFGVAKSSARWNAFGEALRGIQRAYWTVKPREKAALLARYPTELSWREQLRLLHLTCLEVISEGKGRASFLGQQALDDEAVLDTPAMRLCGELAATLMREPSPYRPRQGAARQGKAGNRAPAACGVMHNASVTHLGCLEVIHLDALQQQPTVIDFIPYEDIREVRMPRSSLFSVATITYEDARPDAVVAIPLRYGISWSSSLTCDVDGSMTRFCCLLPKREAGILPGIGVGQQDVVLTDAEDTSQLLGLGSLAHVEFSLDPVDPRN